uniref:Protein amnionless n=1 Tax=Buteo japonicus TaxID=224669 RepID=A0A8C0BE62_9AVES
SGAPGRVRQSAAAAVYKQWIPNTNFETASNWEKGRVPCASDVVRFEKNKVSAIFIHLPRPVSESAVPAGDLGHWNALQSTGTCLRQPGWYRGQLLTPCPQGELLRFGPSSAWFYQPKCICWGCGFGSGSRSAFPVAFPGATVRFADAEHHAWFNPTLWQAVSPDGELEPSGRIFSVDEERVPCRYDDVIFQPETSFRVNVDSSQRELSSPEAWAGYLRGPSAPLQFHGNGTLRVTGTGCPDKSGCACGNAPVSLPIDGHRICAALLGVSGRQCPAPACQSPLQPLGHCCGVCGESLKPLGEFHISTNAYFGMGSAGVPQSPPSPQSQGSVAESQPCSPKTRYMQSVLEGHMGESFPGKASLQNMVETKSLSSNPVNKKTSEGARGFLGQHCSGRAVELPLLSPARPVAQIYWRVLSAFRGSRSCAAVAAVCPGSVTVSCLSVFGLQEPPLTWISLLILTCRSTGTGWSKAC